jgi:hypothetical protein
MTSTNTYIKKKDQYKFLLHFSIKLILRKTQKIIFHIILIYSSGLGGSFYLLYPNPNPNPNPILNLIKDRFFNSNLTLAPR